MTLDMCIRNTAIWPFALYALLMVGMFWRCRYVYRLDPWQSLSVLVGWRRLKQPAWQVGVTLLLLALPIALWAYLIKGCAPG